MALTRPINLARSIFGLSFPPLLLERLVLTRRRVQHAPKHVVLFLLIGV